MIIFDFFKRTFKANTNVKGWIALDEIRQNAKGVKHLFQGISNSSTDQEAPIVFENVALEQGWTQADIEKRKRTHLMTAIVAGFLGLVAFVYMFYFLFYNFMFLTFLICLLLSMLMFLYAVRESYFYYLFKHRRFDLTVKDWYHSLTSKGKTK
jgi:hypothetical protein